MNIANKLNAGENCKLLFIGDSITGNTTWHYPWRIAASLAEKYQQAKVIFRDRQENQIITVADGGGPQQISVIRDGIPGATSYRADQAASIFNPSDVVDFASIFLGINDFLSWNLGLPQYTPQLYMDNISYLANYGKQTQGCEICIVTPAWSEHNLTEQYRVVWGAGFCRYIARKNGFALADVRRVFEDHYTGQGNAGQGNWFSDPADPTHPNAAGHQAIADEIMTVIGI